MNTYNQNRIRPYSKNPYYWQYRGEPVLLLGGSKTDNLFQITDLAAHLDEMVAVGANYVRNTMHARDNYGPDGESLGTYAVPAFKETPDGRYDLSEFNPEYWNRFEAFLEETHKRRIFVQIELFDEHAHCNIQWDKRSVWNPDNNASYDGKDTHLGGSGSYSGANRPHHFFYSVPEDGSLTGQPRDSVLLKFQQAYVDKLLEISLEHDHVLYTVSNEIYAIQGQGWGYYWARYLRRRAAERGQGIEVTEMYWQVDMMKSQQRWSLDNPDIFTYFEASQNSASQNGTVKYWENLQFIRQHLSNNPRPINHTKTYGADTGPSFSTPDGETLQRFASSVIGGAASMRFHRPDTGLGLNDKAKRAIKALRQVTDLVRPWDCEPRMDLIHGAPYDAYLMANPGQAYALYIKNSGSVGLDLREAEGAFSLRWVSLSEGSEAEDLSSVLHGGVVVEMQPPGGDGWIAVIAKET